MDALILRRYGPIPLSLDQQ